MPLCTGSELSMYDLLSPGAIDSNESKVVFCADGKEALIRHVPVQFVPVFSTMTMTAGRLPEGTAGATTNESVEAVVRYPIAVMVTLRFGRPYGATTVGTVATGIPCIGYVVPVF